MSSVMPATKSVLIGSLVLALLAPLSAQDEIVPHPKQLEFSPLEFSVPSAKDHRHVIAGDVPVYVVEDHSLPLVDISILIEAGSYLDPEGHAGLAEAVGEELNVGGTRNMTPEEFEEEVDFLAARIGTSIGATRGSATLNCLTKDLERVLELFFETVHYPRFDEKRFEIYRERVLQGLERRNDETSTIEGREWQRLLRGSDHFSARPVTEASIQALSRDKLLAFHRDYVHPGNFVIAVSGDVDTAQVLEKLEKHLGGWKRGKTAPPVPQPTAPAAPGVFVVDKPEVNQGRVSVGHETVLRSHPDYHALLVMNYILGGGGFTSRIMSRVRSDEGLAYTARSQFNFGTHYPGTFRAYFQSKSPSVAQALALVLEEIETIRTKEVSEEELEGAINAITGSFPRNFASAAQVAGTFAADEIEPRPEGFWENFVDQVKAVKAADVKRAAAEQLDPGKLTILVVGHAEDMLSGNPDQPSYSLEKIAGDQGIREIPLPDPKTMVYPEPGS